MCLPTGPFEPNALLQHPWPHVDREALPATVALPVEHSVTTAVALTNPFAPRPYRYEPIGTAVNDNTTNPVVPSTPVTVTSSTPNLGGPDAISRTDPVCPRCANRSRLTIRLHCEATRDCSWRFCDECHCLFDCRNGHWTPWGKRQGKHVEGGQ